MNISGREILKCTEVICEAAFTYNGNYWLRSSSRNYKDNIQMDDWNRISLSSI